MHYWLIHTSLYKILATVIAFKISKNPLSWERISGQSCKNISEKNSFTFKQYFFDWLIHKVQTIWNGHFQTTNRLNDNYLIAEKSSNNRFSCSAFYTKNKLCMIIIFEKSRFWICFISIWAITFVKILPFFYVSKKE